MKTSPRYCRLCLAFLLACCALPAAAQDSQVSEPDSFERLDADYQSQVLPLVKKYCLTCHSTAQQEGELDLERFRRIGDFRQASGAWLKAAEFLDNGEMPPADAKQPSAEERRGLRRFIQRYLDAEALASAGDPGPVVLRRLSNAEYTFTIRDLTGIPLDPAKEFPADSAAGEGFTNAGAALVMSPALLSKYFDAAKQIADHAVLLPDGFRWSQSTTRSDWTNEKLAEIRGLYDRHSARQGSSQVNLQGIVFNTNDGGRLPVERYLAATLEERGALEAGRSTIEEVARSRDLNPRYLKLLWDTLQAEDLSLLLAKVRDRWRLAGAGDAQALAVEISQWQAALTRFRSVGHMKSWMEPMDLLRDSQEVQWKIPVPEGAAVVDLQLVATSVGGAQDKTAVEWVRPRLVAPGRPDLPLRDVRAFVRDMSARRRELFASTAKVLAAATSASRTKGEIDRAALARANIVSLEALDVWFDYLGIGGGGELKLDLLANKNERLAGYEFISGWSTGELPSLIANSSDNAVRIPGNMKPHGVCVHPTPALAAAAGWLSPLRGEVTVSGVVTHAHPECGNGVTWTVELRRGATRQKLAEGIAQGGKPVPFGPTVKLAVQEGDLISLLIGPRNNDHSCDLTDLELVIKEAGTAGREWSLTADVAPDVHSGNPHADRQGNERVWHFYSEPVQPGAQGPVIPAGSLLARWQSAGDDADRRRIALELEQLLTTAKEVDPQSPDALLRKQLSALGGPLLSAGWKAIGRRGSLPGDRSALEPIETIKDFGLPEELFGRHPAGGTVDPESLCQIAPIAQGFRLPADLVEGATLVTGVRVAPGDSDEGSLQARVEVAQPGDRDSGLRYDTPIVVRGEATRDRFETAFREFRELFPAALCYTKIVPVDEVVTLTLFHREDEPLMRLMLDEAGRRELDRLWNELHFVAHDALTLVDAFAQLMEYATQDSDPGLFEPYRKPIHDRANAFRQELVDAEAGHLAALLDFAGRAYRRKLTEKDERELRHLYQRLREQELPHDEAIRFTLAKVLVSPTFLYRLEQAPAGREAGAISNAELANRLSYFLWSSLPDDELRRAADAGRLTSDARLRQEVRRMLKSPKVRRLATQFACQWLHIYEFDALDEKSERHFPEFAALRGDMYEEVIVFFTDLFQQDRSMWEIFDSDHTFLNPRLARFQGLTDEQVARLFPTIQPDSAEFRRVEGVRALGRGGVLGFPATLAKQSGASRTSPILRGNWVSEVLLGEKLPRPPKDVPRLPEDEAASEGLTVRQLVEQHSSDPRCATCHVRIDPFGFALEGYDPIGRRRERDLAGRPIEATSALADGTRFDGLAGLREHLLTARRSAIQRQFCRKLLGYALGRGVQLSDESLIRQMQAELDRTEGRLSAAIEAIVLSRQFREIRGRDAAIAEAN